MNAGIAPISYGKSEKHLLGYTSTALTTCTQMSCRAAFIRLLILLCLSLGFSLALSFDTLDLSSSLYVVGPGWTKGDGQYSTTYGSLYVSFRGSIFNFVGPANSEATVTLYVDGQSWYTHPDGYYSTITLPEGDHQVMITAKAPDSQPYIFRGIGLSVPDGVRLNATTDYLPQTFGIDATAVLPGTIIMNNKDPCVQFSAGWYLGGDADNDWKNYNNSVAVSTGSATAMTIYFMGRAIWLFSPQKYIPNPSAVKISGSIDSEDIGDIAQSAQTANSVPLNQKLLWSRTNLTNTVHVLRLNMYHNLDDQISFDFARVEGEPMNCTLFATPPGTPAITSIFPLSWDTMEILLLVCGSSFFPFFLFLCLCCFISKSQWRVRRGRRYFGGVSGSKLISAAPLTFPWTAPGQKFTTTDDSSSFTSVINDNGEDNNNREDGTRPMPLGASSQDPPMQVTFPRVMVTPFGPVVLSQRTQPRLPLRRDSKGINPHSNSNPNPPPLAETVEDAISEVIEPGASETGSEVSSLAPSTSVAPILHERDSEWSLSPPPSYMTELRGRQREMGQTRLLTQEDLGRLVDRVTALRGSARNASLNLSPIVSEGSHGLADGRIEEGTEEDDVEILARQIVESGLGSSIADRKGQ